jgi:hypothetical protein
MTRGRYFSEYRRRQRASDGSTESETGPIRWVASSTGREPKSPRSRGDRPRSSLTPWETTSSRGIRDPLPEGDEEPDEGVEGNARLTGMTAVVLLVLLAAEGFTILRIGKLLTLHVVIGMVLVPLTLLKIGSTTWRFARYYLGSPEYTRKGPPHPLLRLLGPFLIVLTIAVIGSGIALLFGPTGMRSEFLLLHKATFIVWLALMAFHVLAHIADTARLAPKDFYWRTRRQIRGASKRQWALVGALCIGLLMGIVVAPKVGPWRADRAPGKTAITGNLSTTDHFHHH